MLFKLTYHVPVSHLELTKTALFDAGAGAMGAYDQCCWQTQGEGQFRPLQGSIPTAGKVGELTRTHEYRVEMVCAATCIQAAVDALKHAHPYETPSYAVWPLADF